MPQAQSIAGVDDGQSPSVMDLEGMLFNKQLLAPENQSIIINSTTPAFNPNMMRGSLNVVARKQEMKRINEGNRKILQQLKDVKPSVGSTATWKKHHKRMSEFRRNMGVAREYNFKRSTVTQGEASDDFRDLKVNLLVNDAEKLPDILATSPKSVDGDPLTAK